MNILECRDTHATRWNGFVARSAFATYCHYYEWRLVFTRSYRLQTWYLALEQDDKWLAVFPVVRLPSLFGMAGKGFSLPYCNYGDVVVADGVDPEYVRQLFLKQLRQSGIDRVEVRTLRGGVAKSGEVTMRLALPDSDEVLWKQVGDKVRNQIRKAQKNEFVLQWGGIELLQDFYSVYAANISRLGTPVHSPLFFSEILTSLSPKAKLLVVRLGERAIGGMLLISCRDTWADPFASTLREFNSLNPNMLMYWEAITFALRNGAHYFDFGRSQFGSGTYRFKKQWGAKAAALDYRTYADGEPAVSSSADLYRGTAGNLAAGLWQRLPECMQLRLGPLLRRRIP